MQADMQTCKIWIFNVGRGLASAIKSPKGKRELMQRLAEYKNCECGTLEAQEVCLFKSDLKPGGAIHTKLRTFVLHE